MITSIKDGDLFKSKCQTLVNAINCKGVMGGGIALEFKNRFPEMNAHYEKLCALGKVRMGEPYLWIAGGPWVLNFPTKDHWMDGSHREDIQKGLQYFLDHYREWGIVSIAFPALGCGLGGLDWDTRVKPMMLDILGGQPIAIELYEPLVARVEAK